MTWRFAKSLARLRDQLNAAYPGRSRSSDGTIGDASQPARASDHNPNDDGVVCAMDITHDPAHGLDARTIAQRLLDSRDERIKYVISNRRICSGPTGPKPWVWRPYTGKNPHDHHFHISVRSPAKFYDSTRDWDLGATPSALPLPEVTPAPLGDINPMLKLGITGDNVVRLQRLLNYLGVKLVDDGVFGPRTRAAVIAFQKHQKIVADGVVGTYTWQKLQEQK